MTAFVRSNWSWFLSGNYLSQPLFVKAALLSFPMALHAKILRQVQLFSNTSNSMHSTGIYMLLKSLGVRFAISLMGPSTSSPVVIKLSLYHALPFLQLPNTQARKSLFDINRMRHDRGQMKSILSGYAHLIQEPTQVHGMVCLFEEFEYPLITISGPGI